MSTPSANWLSLRQTLDSKKRKRHWDPEISKKKSRVEDVTAGLRRSTSASVSVASEEPNAMKKHERSTELKPTFREMILGRLHFSDNQQEPGKYLAVDCEMVGVGIDGSESSLARVSVVNFHGAVILDEFVRQKERVVDYRTQWSGIREKDMIKAKPFADIQQKVADLLQDKILVGHAVHNDLKALLLSHPRQLTRDTQIYAHKFGLTKSNRPALKNLVKQELDLTIQSGEHSSVTDARATMAIYRLHKKEWEKGSRPPPSAKTSVTRAISSDSSSKAEKQDLQHVSSEFPGGGRRGVSLGLATIVSKGEKMPTNSRREFVKGGKSNTKSSKDWWKELPGGNLKGFKLGA